MADIRSVCYEHIKMGLEATKVPGSCSILIILIIPRAMQLICINPHPWPHVVVLRSYCPLCYDQC